MWAEVASSPNAPARHCGGTARAHPRPDDRTETDHGVHRGRSRYLSQPRARIETVPDGKPDPWRRVGIRVVDGTIQLRRRPGSRGNQEVTSNGHGGRPVALSSMNIGVQRMSDRTPRGLRVPATANARARGRFGPARTCGQPGVFRGVDLRPCLTACGVRSARNATPGSRIRRRGRGQQQREPGHAPPDAAAASPPRTGRPDEQQTRRHPAGGR